MTAFEKLTEFEQQVFEALAETGHGEAVDYGGGICQGSDCVCDIDERRAVRVAAAIAAAATPGLESAADRARAAMKELRGET